MKKYIIVLILLFIIYQTAFGQSDFAFRYAYRDLFHLGIFEYEFVDENNMTITIHFQDSDFFAIGDDESGQYVGKYSAPDYGQYGFYYCYYGMNKDKYIPCIPSSGFTVLLPSNREVESVEYDVVDSHLWKTDITLCQLPFNNATSSSSRAYKIKAAYGTDNHWTTYEESIYPAFVYFYLNSPFNPFRLGVFYYSPFTYDLDKKELWLANEIKINVKLKSAEQLSIEWDIKGELKYLKQITRPRLLCINLGDIETFYGNIINGIKTVHDENTPTITDFKNGEIYGSIAMNIKTAVLEIRNTLGLTIEKRVIAERGNFISDLKGLPAGLYLCSLITDGKLAVTKKICINH